MVDDPNILANVGAREIFKDAVTIVDSVRQFAVEPPETNKDIEAHLAALHTQVRREGWLERPPQVTSEVLNALKASGEATEIPHFERLQEVMRSVKFPGTDQQLMNGTGAVSMIHAGTGLLSFTEAEGPIHNMEPVYDKTDGQMKKPFPGGLGDYAIGKALVEAAIGTAGMDDESDDQHVNDWASKVTGVSIHMGGATGKDAEGNAVYCGVSGAEMTKEAIALLNRSLRYKESKDDDFTCAGYVDTIVARWTLRLAAGEEITPEQAQADIDDAFALFRELDEVAPLPPYFH